MMYVLGVVMAGGRGERLYPLTQHRAKPAVPFGGRYRIIDFVLSNFVNSGILSIYVVTQFKAQSLLEHLDRGWRATDFLGDHFITPVPAQMRSGDDWYQGTADSVYQNLYLLERHNPKLVAVFGADHIYRMNIRQMIDEHQKQIGRSHRRGDSGEDRRGLAVRRHRNRRRLAHCRFRGKAQRTQSRFPANPTLPWCPWATIFSTMKFSIEALKADAANPASNHDFGRDLLPGFINNGRMFAYDFRKNRVPSPSKGEEPSYWRDLGHHRSLLRRQHGSLLHRSVVQFI